MLKKSSVFLRCWSGPEITRHNEDEGFEKYTKNERVRDVITTNVRCRFNEGS